MTLGLGWVYVYVGSAMLGLYVGSAEMPTNV